MASGAASTGLQTGHRGPGDAQPPAAAQPAAGRGEPGEQGGPVGANVVDAAYHDAMPQTAQPFPQTDEHGGPPTPTGMSPTDPPPGVDQDQLPQAHLGRGVKRDTEAPMPSSRRGIRPPDPKVKGEETQRSFIGTPGREPPEHEDGAESVIDSEHEAARSQSSALDHEIKDDETVNDVLKQVAAAMEGINKSIELMSKRVELIEGQKRKADDPDTLQSINNKDVDKPAKFDGKQ